MVPGVGWGDGGGGDGGRACAGGGRGDGGAAGPGVGRPECFFPLSICFASSFFFLPFRLAEWGEGGGEAPLGRHGVAPDGDRT